jgi:hypothetical protein
MFFEKFGNKEKLAKLILTINNLGIRNDYLTEDGEIKINSLDNERLFGKYNDLRGGLNINELYLDDDLNNINPSGSLM